ncbi:MAG: superoxide dismutase [Bacteroidia bacterium]|nr:superoxide dismutase [Bacteroidia bacterium]
MSEYTLAPLPYAFSDLEPHIDTKTMELHYGKHHQAYVTQLNKALANTGKPAPSLDNLMQTISKYGVAVRNNGGGHFNHTLFWQMMQPNGGGQPQGKLADMITLQFGSFEKFKQAFKTAALSQFGSGWAWLIQQRDTLKITTTPNQDNPRMDVVVKSEQGNPLLCIDVWEHAYYLKHQNMRANYIDAFFNVVNWNFISKRLS